MLANALALYRIYLDLIVGTLAAFVLWGWGGGILPALFAGIGIAMWIRLRVISNLLAYVIELLLKAGHVTALKTTVREVIKQR